MSEVSNCPNRDVFVGFLTGNLAEEQIGRIVAHLEGCDSCGDTLRSMNVEDTISDLLSTPNDREEVAPSGSLFERLETLVDESVSNIGDTEVAEDTEARVREVSVLWAPPESEEEIGRLGPYRILSVLGAGGMGVVFRAEDLQLKRCVALKILRPSLGKQAKERFLQEAQCAAAVQHDNVVTIYQVGTEGSLAYIAMQWLDGETLESRLQRDAKLSSEEVRRIGGDIASGLAAAHAQQLIHRDVKPANVWLEAERDRAKLLDFGLARAVNDSPDLTETGMIAGTPGYMSPEQSQGRSLDERSDLFSLGTVLYRMLTSKLPFEGANALATIHKIQQHVPDAPRQTDISVPVTLSDTVMDLLEKDPRDRPQTAEEVAICLADQTRPVRTGLKTQSQSTKSRVGNWVAVALLLFGIATAGIVYRVQTDKGEIVIESDDPGVVVQLSQGGEVVTLLNADSKKRVSLQSGDYKAEISGDATGLSLTPSNIELTRSGEVIVTVSNMKPVEPKANQENTAEQDELFAEASAFANDYAGKDLVSALQRRFEIGYGRAARLAEQMEPNSKPPERTFNGQTYLEWIRILKRETEPSLLLPAVKAVRILANTPERQKEVTNEIFELMEIHGLAFGRQNSGPRSDLVDEVEAVLYSLAPEVVIPLLLGRVESTRSGQLREFLNRFAGYRHGVPKNKSLVHTEMRHFVETLQYGAKEEKQKLLKSIRKQPDNIWLTDWFFRFAYSFGGFPEEADPELREIVIKTWKRGGTAAISVQGIVVSQYKDTPDLAKTIWSTWNRSLELGHGTKNVAKELEQLGEYSKPVVPDIAKEVVRLTEGGGWSENVDLLLELLTKLGPAAEQALPTLQDVYIKNQLNLNPDQHVTIVNAITAIDAEFAQRLTSSVPSTAEGNAVPGPLPSTVPAYNEKTLTEWLDLARTEQNPEKVIESLEAMANLIQHPQHKEHAQMVAETVFRVLQRYGSFQPGSSKNAHQVSIFAAAALHRIPESIVVELIANEFEAKSNKSIQSLLWLQRHLRTSDAPNDGFGSHWRTLANEIVRQSNEVAEPLPSVLRKVANFVVDKDNDELTRQCAAEFLDEVISDAKLPARDGLQDIWKSQLRESNLDIRCIALKRLAHADGDPQEMLEPLTQTMDDLVKRSMFGPADAVFCFHAAIRELSESHAKEMEPLVSPLLRMYRKQAASLRIPSGSIEMRRSGFSVSQHELVLPIFGHLGKIGTPRHLPELRELLIPSNSHAFHWRKKPGNKAVREILGFESVTEENAPRLRAMLDDLETTDEGVGKKLARLEKLMQDKENAKFGLDVTQAVFKLMRKYGVQSDAITKQAQKVLFAIGGETVVEGLVEELSSPNRKSTSFISCLLTPDNLRRLGWDMPEFWEERFIPETLVENLSMFTGVGGSQNTVARLLVRIEHGLQAAGHRFLKFRSGHETKVIEFLQLALFQGTEKEIASAALYLSHRVKPHEEKFAMSLRDTASRLIRNSREGVVDSLFAMRVLQAKNMEYGHRPAIERFLKSTRFHHATKSEDGSVILQFAPKDLAERTEQKAYNGSYRTDPRVLAITVLAELGADAEKSVPLLRRISTDNPKLKQHADKAIAAILQKTAKD